MAEAAAVAAEPPPAQPPPPRPPRRRSAQTGPPQSAEGPAGSIHTAVLILEIQRTVKTAPAKRRGSCGARIAEPRHVRGGGQGSAEAHGVDQVFC
eukprot:53989-Chlamydomonas_euryale.AAC.2